MVRYAKFLVLVLLLLALVVTGCAPAPTPAPEATPTKAPPPPEATPTEVPATPTPAEAVPKQGGTLTLSLGTDPRTMDCQHCSGIPNLGIINMVAETLTRVNPTGEEPTVLPLLATSWEVSPDDPNTWIFHLREGVKFHDGTPFNAEAVKVNIERMLNPENKAGGRSAFTMITSVEVVDEYTVAITSDSPFMDLPGNLAYSVMCINSPTQLEKLGEENYYTYPIGTGPFKFVEHKKGEEVRLEANEEYWGGRPFLDEFVMKPIPETPSRIMALEAGEVDVAYHVPPRDAQRFKENPDLGIEVLNPPSQRRIFVGMNNLWGPFKDVRVRQALNYAVDQQAIIDNILLGLTIPMDSPMPPSAACYSPIMQYEYNPDKAKELLAEAGYPDGFKATLRYGEGRYLLDSEVVQAVAAYLADVGVEVEVIPLEWGTYIGEIWKPPEENDTQLFFIGWGLPTLTPDMGVSFFTTDAWSPASLNSMFYSNPELDALVAEGRGVLDPEERCEVYKSAQQIIMEDASAIWLYFEPQIHAKRTYVKDFTISVSERVDQMHKTWLETE